MAKRITTSLSVMRVENGYVIAIGDYVRDSSTTFVAKTDDERDEIVRDILNGDK